MNLKKYIFALLLVSVMGTAYAAAPHAKEDKNTTQRLETGIRAAIEKAAPKRTGNPAKAAAGDFSEEEHRQYLRDRYADSPECSCCHHCYTEQERQGETEHVCRHEDTVDQNPDTQAQPRAQKQKTRYCIFCGEEIHGTQECSSGNVRYCTTSCPECGRDLTNPANVDADGVHHCRGKMKIKCVEPKQKRQEITSCPGCGRDLTNPANLDEEGNHHCREKFTINVRQ